MSTTQEVERRRPAFILDHLLEGCQVISPDYRYLYVNDAVVRHGRTKRDALLGKKMEEVYPGIEQTEMFATLQQCMKTQKVALLENEFSFPDGSSGWFELRFEPVPEGIAILSIDITARKRAEDALRRTMRALATLSRCNQALIRAVDEVEVARDVCRLIVEVGEHRAAWIDLVVRGGPGSVETIASAGPSPSTTSGLDWCQRLASRALRDGKSLFARTQSSERESSPSASCAVFVLEGDGSILGTLTIVSSRRHAFDTEEIALLDEVATNLAHGIWTIRARREHEQTHARLQEAELRVRATYDHLPHATYVWGEYEGVPVLLDYNEAARRSTDDAVVALLGSSCGEGWAGVPEIANDLARCLESGEAIEREVDAVLPGRKASRRLVLSYGYIDSGMVLLHAEDITEQRRTEAQLVGAQRLEAVGRLAGGVAHDFNNILSVIMSYSEFAAQQLHAADPIRQDLEEVRSAGHRAAHLTRQLLAFSRKQPLEPRVTNLNKVIGDIDGMIRRLVRENIEIMVHAEVGLGNILADPGQLEQVLMNLVVNARDAMPEGGTLTIETANVELDQRFASERMLSGPGMYVQLAVSDTGEGMDAETRTRVFEPFFTTKEKGKGTGLGLSTVYGIVKQSGGSISVYSELGSGTSFKIHFPRIDAPVMEPEQRRESGAAITGDETILVVEDDSAVRGAAARILEAAGYSVLTAANGIEALALSEQEEHGIDVLLTDVIMPRMSGTELSRRLNEKYPGMRTIFTSGYADHAAINHGLLTSSANFVSKPFSSRALTKKIRHVLDEEPE